MADTATIVVSGLSASGEITVERASEKTLADVLAENDIDAQDLTVKVDGVSVDPSDVSVENGQRVVAAPQPKLG